MADPYVSKQNLIYYKGKYDTLMTNKVDKVSGKQLSTNDYTDAEKTKLSGIATGADVSPTISTDITTDASSDVKTASPKAVKTYVDNVASNKVDKVSGKGLSTNDYTTAEQEKLAGIASGADVSPVISTDISTDATSNTKTASPKAVKTYVDGVADTKVDKVSGKGLSANDYTTTEKNKLAGIAAGADVSPTISTDISADASSDAKTASPKAVKTYVDGVASNKVDKVSGKGLSANDYTDAEKTKLEGIATGADVSPTISTDISADASSNTKTASPKAVKTYVDDIADDKVDKESGKGLSTNDYTTAEKTKLSGIETGANKYVHPAQTARTKGLYKITVDGTGHVTAVEAQGTVTSSADGLMLSTDKAKLDGFSEATAYALKTDITSVYKYKGSVATYADLPSTGQVAGDVYDVQADGKNYAWTGTAWDSLGGTFSITPLTTDEIDEMFT